MRLFSWVAKPFVKAAIKEYAPLVVFTFVAAILLGYLIRGCTGEPNKVTIGGTMDNFTMVWGTISVLVVWLTQTIGRKLPGDVPVLSFAVSLILNGLGVYATAYFLGIPWEISVFWPYITTMQVGSQGLHALAKTGTQNGFKVPLMAPKAKADHSN